MSSSARSSRTQPAVDSIVTRLLVAIKQLLEALQLWSTGAMSDIDVSNVYVQLGNEFNSAVAAFSSYRIDMSDLEYIPQALREVLEAALANDASPQVLEIYLPQVRTIISNLLNGLRSKQNAYREAAAARQQRRSRGEPMAPGSKRHDRQSSSSSSTVRSDRPRPSGGRDPRPSSGGTPADTDASRTRRTIRSTDSPNQTDGDITPQRYSSRPSGTQATPRTTSTALPNTIPEDEPLIAELTNGSSSNPAPDPNRNGSDIPSQSGPLPVPRRTALTDEARAEYGSDTERERPYSRSSNAASKSNGLGPARTMPASRVNDAQPVLRRGQSAQAQLTRTSQRIAERPSTPPPPANNAEETVEPPIPSPPLPSPVPSNVKRYSLSDNPVPRLQVDAVESQFDRVKEERDDASQDGTVFSSSATLVDGSDNGISPSSNAGSVSMIPETSLTDLKSSQQLNRRASKRYSMYTFAKLTNSTSGADRNNRKSMLAPSSFMTPNDLDAVAEEEDGSEQSFVLARSTSSRIKRSMRDKAYGDLTRKPSKELNIVDPGRQLQKQSPSDSALPPALPPSRDPSPIPPALPTESTTESTPPPPPADGEPNIFGARGSTNQMEPSTSRAALSSTQERLTVFLQLGRQVKKVSLDTDGLSFASLRVLFVDKFSYTPGSSNFPSIYIRDPSSGVQYELEAVDEVQDKCLLSLNIEPLDQIKEQIDSQMATLTQDIRDLKSTVLSTRRQSMNVPVSATYSAPELVTPVERPSDKQFRSAAKRLTRVMTRVDGQLSFTRESSPAPPVPSSSPPPAAPIAPQMTGNSLVSDERASRMVADLKTQFDEVQHLRRDMGVMRQIYTDFITSTKEALGAVRAQAQSVRELANQKVGGARAYIDTGKARLDTRSQGILTRMDDLQDTVEGIRDDVLKRRMTPKPAVVKSLKADIASSAAELESLTEMITTTKPIWKQTWEEELQNIVEEQQFLSHQEELIKDLVEDHKELAKVFGRIEDVASHRVVRTRQPAFRPPPPDEGHEGLSTVMLEIRGAQVDSHVRLKAIEENQRLRDRERAAKSDEFQEELAGFVDGKKLKMIGGAEEAERVRQLRNDMVLKAMFQTTAPLQYSSK